MFLITEEVEDILLGEQSPLKPKTSFYRPISHILGGEQTKFSNLGNLSGGRHTF